jgi:hypothetical protein
MLMQNHEVGREPAWHALARASQVDMLWTTYTLDANVGPGG